MFSAEPRYITPEQALSPAKSLFSRLLVSTCQVLQGLVFLNWQVLIHGNPHERAGPEWAVQDFPSFCNQRNEIKLLGTPQMTRWDVSVLLQHSSRASSLAACRTEAHKMQIFPNRQLDFLLYHSEVGCTKWCSKKRFLEKFTPERQL